MTSSTVSLSNEINENDAPRKKRFRQVTSFANGEDCNDSEVIDDPTLNSDGVDYDNRNLDPDYVLPLDEYSDLIPFIEIDQNQQLDVVFGESGQEIVRVARVSNNFPFLKSENRELVN